MHDAIRLEESDIALARSAVYRALSIGFTPVDSGRAPELLEDVGRTTLGDALETLGLDASPAGDLTRCERDAVSLELDRVFGHTPRGGVCPFETDYGSDTSHRQTHELSDIAGFFSAFGLELDASAHERPDHVRCECELMAFLALKESLALQLGDGETAAATRRAEQLFLRDHLGRFAPALGGALERAGGSGYFGALGRVLVDVVTADCQRFDVRLGAATLPLRTEEEDPVPMACGDGSCGWAGDGGECES